MLTAIPCTLMRGGTSKGLYFHAQDLPADRQLRDRVLLAAMGSPDVRQIDGVGGAHPLTSKVAVIEQGLVTVAGPTTPVRIHMVNTGGIAVANVPTPAGVVEYEGDARIDGVPGTAAAIPLEFLDVAGSS
jgi:4-oxalomesaconate tautomerase